MKKLLIALGLAALAASSAFAEDPAVQTSNWSGFKSLNFKIDGRQCMLVVPKTPAEGNPWVWRTEFFGHEPQGDIALLEKGFHAAYIDVQNMYGAPVAMGHMDALYAHVTAKYGLSPKTVLEGFSRGGLFAFNWAAKNPDKVACIYTDAPVCDFKSWPGGKGKGKGSAGDWQGCQKAYGFTEAEAMAYKFNPVDNLEPLAKAKIPLLHVCGETDDVVPIEENTRLIEQRYKALGGAITVIAKPFNGHHPHSLKDPTHIVNFILKNTGHENLITKAAETPYGYDYISPRAGLKNCRLKFEQNKFGKVLVLGALAELPGFREAIASELQRRFPNGKFEVVSGPDSPGAADLFLADTIASDKAGTDIDQIHAAEAGIRAARTATPAIDIILLNLPTPAKIEAFNQNKVLPISTNPEKVADHYAIPSLNLAKEVTERIHAGELASDKDPKELAAVYARAARRLFDIIWKDPLSANAAVQPYTLPNPL